MENQQVTMQVETKVESKKMIVKLRLDLFKKMINDSRDHPKDKDVKVLNSKALNQYLASELSGLEKESIKIIHKSSIVKSKKERADSKYLVAHASCGQSTQCKLTYVFVVIDQPNDMIEYVEIQTEIKGKILN